VSQQGPGPHVGELERTVPAYVDGPLLDGGRVDDIDGSIAVAEADLPFVARTDPLGAR
jgi:hypothetical protein